MSDYPEYDQMSTVKIQWRKSSASAGNGQCVEAAPVGGGVAVRDSKDPTGPVLRFTPEEWQVFLVGAKAGEFDDLTDSGG